MGVSAQEAEAAAPIEFTATWGFGSQVRSGTTEVVDGVIENRGHAWRTGESVAASDPRLTDTMTNAGNEDDYGVGGPSVWSHAFRIENDEGVWQQIPSINLGFPDGSLHSRIGVLVGEGGYTGLIAVFENAAPRAGTWDLRGYIIEGELPPPPEPYVTN